MMTSSIDNTVAINTEIISRPRRKTLENVKTIVSTNAATVAGTVNLANPKTQANETVSYTHLTLPTILLV